MGRQVHAAVIASVDGFHADLSDSYTFAAAGGSRERAVQAREHLRPYDMFVFGRVTYERGATSWASDAARNGRDPELVTAMNTRPRLLFSRTTTVGAWGPTDVHAGELPGVISRLKRQDGGDLLVIGSASIRTALLEARLLDRITVTYVPVALGAGRPVFEGCRAPQRATVAHATVMAGGAVEVDYRFSCDS